SFSSSGRKVIRQTKSRKVPRAPAMENSRMPWPGVSASEAKLTKVVSMVSAAAGPTSLTVASTALFGSMPSRQKASQLKTKNMDSAKEITRTSVVTMMVRKEKEPKNSRIMPIDHITARNGVAATMMAPKKERSAKSAMMARSEERRVGKERISRRE